MGTNPILYDTDGDTFSDGFEVAQGSDPLSIISTPETIHIPLLPWLASFILFITMAGIASRRQTH